MAAVKREPDDTEVINLDSQEPVVKEELRVGTLNSHAKEEHSDEASYRVKQERDEHEVILIESSPEHGKGEPGDNGDKGHQEAHMRGHLHSQAGGTNAAQVEHQHVGTTADTAVELSNDELAATTQGAFVKKESNAMDIDVKPNTSRPNEPRTNKHLEHLLSIGSPETLEEGVAAGLNALDSLKPPLEAVESNRTTQAAHWLKAIQELQSRAKPTRTIVGVVGNTGAGKSSVISAVLDEERLLPTNCMRACTASPTEISWNCSEDPNELYRAEVEFITAQDWTKELQALYIDLLDGNGEISRECTNPECEAGVAYAKIKAVYPRKTREVIASANPDTLATEPAVASVLGTTKKLKATTAAGIYRQLQQYVDSKEKNSEKNMEYWPLIKVVRIFTKASALSTGACLVDLPGVQDSNAARAAVAESYMKACTGLWIVAPITRAVDDKTAKSLLGDSFRRQLKYDGTYSAVTFICSKTDDISVTEAVDSLDMEDQVAENWSRIRDNKKMNARLREQVATLRDEKETLDQAIDDNEQAWDRWNELSEKCADGETVYAPKEAASKKRKRTSKPPGTRKNRKSADSEDESDFAMSEESDADKENDRPQDEDRQALTEDDIEKKMAELKAEKKTLREKKRAIDEQLTQLRKQVRKLSDETCTLTEMVKSWCIKGRNEYSRKAIKHDFAMGIKELDQEAAVEEDEANFDPEVDLRDYDAVAESLPVFCVSSRAFQGLSGRLQRDDVNVSGFRDINDTEIPQLQAHAKKLTEQGRVANSRRFLTDLLQLMNSLIMWAGNDGSRMGYTPGEKRSEEAYVRRELQAVEKEFRNAIAKCSKDTVKEFNDHIYDNFDHSVPTAMEAAVPTAAAWGAPRAQGGLFWATYKATCRRNGVFTGASGPRDFNAELFEPISIRLANGWERAFQRRLPKNLDKFVERAKHSLAVFHKSVTARTSERLPHSSGIALLDNQLRAVVAQLSEVPHVLKEESQRVQREASRNFTPRIQQIMERAYDVCTNERGPGSYVRMKAAMLAHVDEVRSTMFHDATNVVRGEIDAMIRQMEATMTLHMQDLHARIARDYLAVLVGSDVSAEGATPRTERMLRAEMASLLESADDFFAGLATASVDAAADAVIISPEPEADERAGASPALAGQGPGQPYHGR